MSLQVKDFDYRIDGGLAPGAPVHQPFGVDSEVMSPAVFLVPGQGLAVGGQTLRFDRGAVLWLESGRRPVCLDKGLTVRVTVLKGLPYLELLTLRRDKLLFSRSTGEVETRLRIPLIDVLGLAAIDENAESVRDALVCERKATVFH